MLKDKINQYEEKRKDMIEGISDYIFKNPELGEEEFKSSKYQIDLLRKLGFKVENPYMGMPTAFRAEYGDDDGVKIAFLSEYDALPGYFEDKVPAHACGHNFIAASAMGGGIVLADMIRENKLKAKSIIIGTPAEETIGGKVPMVENHAFDDVDFVFQAHLGAKNDLNCKFLAIDCIEFEFFGKASHAAGYPEEGINALDSATLMFAGINALRQHVVSTSRIHGIIKDGGMAPNTVPDYARTRFHIRATNRKYLDSLTEKIINIARGAALMTGASMKYHKYENSFDELRNVSKLQNVMEENVKNYGITDIFKGIINSTGSSDIGNVSLVVPTMYMEVYLNSPEKCFVHEEKIIKYVNSDIAYDRLHRIIKAFVGSSLDLINDKKLRNDIKEEFNNLR